MYFYKLFELKCVLEVCVLNHPIMIKIHPVFFFFYLLKFILKIILYPFLKSSCLSMWCHMDGCSSHDCWLTVAFQHLLHWCLTSDRCCAQFCYPLNIGRFRVRIRGGVRIRQSYNDFNERGNNLSGGRKWAQHQPWVSCHQLFHRQSRCRQEWLLWAIKVFCCWM